VSDERGDPGPAHLARVALAGEEDVVSGPVGIGLLGADAAVLAVEQAAYLAEELGWARLLSVSTGMWASPVAGRGRAHGVLRVLGAFCLGQV